jgi:hypothetical protein
VASSAGSGAESDTSGDSDGGSSSSSAGQTWRASCADGFAELLQRYPHQLRLVAPICIEAAEHALQSVAIHAEACALLVRNIPADMLPDDKVAHRHVLAAMGHPEMPHSIALLHASDASHVHIEVSG